MPVYRPPLGQEESAEAARACGRRRPSAIRSRGCWRRAASVASVPWQESLRRIDLDAPAPTLPPAKARPSEVPLEDLWFYKDQDALVRDALELGVIQRRAFPVHSPDSFRKILEGEKSNAFRAWIKSVRFKPRGET